MYFLIYSFIFFLFVWYRDDGVSKYQKSNNKITNVTSGMMSNSLRNKIWLFSRHLIVVVVTVTVSSGVGSLEKRWEKNNNNCSSM